MSSLNVPPTRSDLRLSGQFQSRKRTQFKANKRDAPRTFIDAKMNSLSRGVSVTIALEELDDGSLDVTKGWKALLAEGNSVRRDDAVVAELVCGGPIPKDLTGDIFMFLCGARDERQRYAEDYFARLISRVRGKQQDEHLWSKDIEKDLLRTLPDLGVFQNDEVMRNRLRDILTAFSIRTPSVGYCQGINVLCASLLLLGLTDEQTFWVLASLVEQSIGFYTSSMVGLEVDMQVFADLIKFYCPDVHAHLELHQVKPKSFAIAWFMLLFIDSPLTFEQGLEFLPFFMLYGDAMRFQVAVGILQAKKEEILTLDSQETTLKYFLGESAVGQDVPLQAILKSVTASVDLDDFQTHMKTARHFHRREVLRQRSVLNHFQVRRLREKVQFDSEEDLNDIWRAFLEPDPWNTLTQSCLVGVHNFLQGFLPLLFLPTTRRSWRGDGVFSKTFYRLHRALDVDGIFDDCLSFIEVVDAVKVFSVSRSDYAHKARIRITGNFIDADRAGDITQQQLTEALCCVHSLYQGHPNDHHLLACGNIALVVFRLVSYDREHQGTLRLALSSESWSEVRQSLRVAMATYPVVVAQDEPSAAQESTGDILSGVWEETANENKLVETISVEEALSYLFLDPFLFDFFRLRYFGADHDGKRVESVAKGRAALTRRAYSQDQVLLSRGGGRDRARSRHRPRQIQEVKQQEPRRREGSDLLKSVSNWFDNFLT